MSQPEAGIGSQIRRKMVKGSTITLGTVEQVGGSTTAENLGVNLQESKQIAKSVARHRGKATAPRAL